MNRGRRGEVTFTGKNDHNAFIELLKELIEDYNVKIAAYFLMSNHYHLLFQNPDANISRSLAPDLDRIMEKVCKFYKVKKDDLLVSRRGYFNSLKV